VFVQLTDPTVHPTPQRTHTQNAAYANAGRESAFDLRDLPSPTECGVTVLNMGDLRTASYTEATSGVTSDDATHPTSASHADITAKDNHLALKVAESEKEAAAAQEEAERKAAKKKKSSGGCCSVQ
jgi:di/tripeptidase